tara:strand:- start:6132 stop:8279 length:2148 start_codon:yes stop_codon:yes gene_type:complete
MSQIEEFYFGHENVLVFANLDDIGQPYTCEDWGDRGVQFGASPLITDDGPGSDLWGKFNTGGYFPSVAFVDHTMTVHYKQSGGPSLALTQSIINQMLDKLYSSLLISANFTTNFNGDADADGLINPGDSFDVIISVMNKSYDESNSALNVNLELSSNCDGLTITSNNLGQIGNISAGDTYQVEATITIDDSVIINDYFLDLVISTDNIDDDGNSVIEQFSTDFSVTLNQAGFPADVSGELISSAAITDFDNDGQNEIISSDKGGFIHVFEMDGTEWMDETFPYETGDQNWGSPSVGNLDGDGFEDVVISSKNGHIYIFSSSQLLDFNSGGYITATPALGDVDGDGLDEIVFGQYGNPKLLYAINFDGSSVEGFPYDLDEKVQRGVALADFNGNGKDDIVVGTDDEFIHLIYDDGTLGWSYETGGDIRVSPTVIALPNTGDKIILVGSKDDNFYALNSDGSLRFIIETDDDISTEASIIEVADVGPVIFFASGSMLYAVDIDGNTYGNWGIDIGSDISSSIVFANIGEIIYAMFGDEAGNAYMHDMTTNSYSNFPISYSFPFKGSPVVLDTDNDGDLEFIIGSTQNLVNIDIKEEGVVDNLWSTHRSNMKRNGYYISETALEIVGDISDRTFSIISAYPNPFNPSVNIKYFMDASDIVEISVVNLEGKVIEVLESSFKGQGEHSVIWAPSNISSGVYLLNIATLNNSATHKLMFIK